MGVVGTTGGESGDTSLFGLLLGFIDGSKNHVEVYSKSLEMRITLLTFGRGRVVGISPDQGLSGPKVVPLSFHNYDTVPVSFTTVLVRLYRSVYRTPSLDRTVVLNFGTVPILTSFPSWVIRSSTPVTVSTGTRGS